MNTHRVDRILDAIDAGPQRTTEASYGETKEPGWCWRCLLTPVEHAEQMCDDCRKWMGGESDDDPRTRERKYNFAPVMPNCVTFEGAQFHLGTSATGPTYYRASWSARL